MASFALCSSFNPVTAAARTSYREAAPASLDYGRVLGVAPNASKREVKAAYRKLALQCHPDVCKGEECEVSFAEVNRAYESLMALPSYATPGSRDDEDPWAEFLESLAKGTTEQQEPQVDYASYYSNLRCYRSKARRSKSTYPGSSQYYQGNW